MFKANLQPGSGDTPRASIYNPADFSVTEGASVRMIVDVGHWDNSLVINAPGQSGDLESTHYKDLKGKWADGTYVPLLFSKKAVRAAAERTIVLLPAQR